jgi:tetratricopeptide (TPR) repeat protein
VLESDNETARIGLARAQVLDEVLALMEQADDLFGDGELEAARDMYEQIVGLDSYNEAAPQRISEIDVQIRENEFSAIMSEGYALLQAGDPEQAIATFQRAAAMGINQQQAQAAVQQTETQVANAQINGLQQEITAAEASERWQDAVDAYDKVLEIDANLLFAIQGRELANQRATLNQLLVNAIEAPERLSENDVYEENLRYYFIGRDIENPGPVLREQLDELQVLLENSQVPIDIDFISDTFTEVTLLKNGNLGKFRTNLDGIEAG